MCELDKTVFMKICVLLGSIILQLPGRCFHSVPQMITSDLSVAAQFACDLFNQLINQIHNNPTTVLALAALMSAFAALAAVIVAPTLGLMATNRQVRANVRSTNRQAWINELRNEIAQALSLLTEAMAMKKSSLSYEERIKTVVRYDLHFSKIQLLINPKEQDHRYLCTNLAQAMLALNKYLVAEQDDRSELENISKAILQISQPILKREWERVKGLK